MAHELSCLEICAGAGGQSLGLEQAGFAHAAAVELSDRRLVRIVADLHGHMAHMCATCWLWVGPELPGHATRPEIMVAGWSGREPPAALPAVARGVPALPAKLGGRAAGSAAGGEAVAAAELPHLQQLDREQVHLVQAYPQDIRQWPGAASQGWRRRVGTTRKHARNDAGARTSESVVCKSVGQPA